MDWYFMVWRKFAVFDGRARRKEFWMFALFNILALLALAALGGVGLAINEDYGGVLFVPLGIYYLAMIIPNLAVTVRRLHDTGKSGWLLLLFFVLGCIPFVGIISGIIQLVFMCTDSDPGQNEYGPNPKYPELAWMAAGNAGLTSTGLGAQAHPFTGGKAIIYCKNCGKRIENGSQFCSGNGIHA